MNFTKAYVGEYNQFKKRYIESGLGNEMDAQNAWRYLLGQNKYYKKNTLKKLRDSNMKIQDLSTLNNLIRASIED